MTDAPKFITHPACEGKRKSSFLDLTGTRFGRITVLGFHSRAGKFITWYCRCDCGKETVVHGGNLKSGHTRSCGCLEIEVRSKGTMFRHGASANDKETPEFVVWKKIRERCLSQACPAYADYGGRGIGMCQSWQDDFTNFLNDMGPRPPGTSIDRINNDLGYFKENCRWATQIQQANNKRNNIRIEFNGETKTRSEWARHLGFNYPMLQGRLKNGWSVERAFKTPKMINGSTTA